jgi:hypothetical protein
MGPGDCGARRNLPALISTEKPTHTTAMTDKYCSLMRAAYSFTRRATLPALLVTAALVLNTTAIAQSPPGSLWYNGDFNGVDGQANERNTLISQAAIYENFNITGGPMWDVTAVFSDNLENTFITGADWEIRTGISTGNAGTLIASGTTNSPVVTPTGRSGFGYTEYMVEVTGLNVFLPMLPSGQHYWLNVTPVGNGTGRSFNTWTSGTNCVGTPCGDDGNSFFNSTYYGVFFQPLSGANPRLLQWRNRYRGSGAGNGSATHLRRGSTADRRAPSAGSLTRGRVHSA